MPSYVAVPEGDYPKDTVILFCTDVFGPQLINAQVCTLPRLVLRTRANLLINDGSCSRTASPKMGLRLVAEC